MMALLLLAAGALGRGASHTHPPPPPPIAPPPGFKPCYENASLASLPFCTPTLPAARRAADLVGRMTLAEKFGQLLNNRGEAIPRLGASLAATFCLSRSPRLLPRLLHDTAD